MNDNLWMFRYKIYTVHTKKKAIITSQQGIYCIILIELERGSERYFEFESLCRGFINQAISKINNFFELWGNIPKAEQMCHLIGAFSQFRVCVDRSVALSVCLMVLTPAGSITTVVIGSFSLILCWVKKPDWKYWYRWSKTISHIFLKNDAVGMVLGGWCCYFPSKVPAKKKVQSIVFLFFGFFYPDSHRCCERCSQQQQQRVSLSKSSEV